VERVRIRKKERKKERKTFMFQYRARHELTTASNIYGNLNWNNRPAINPSAANVEYMVSS
jgi:hypothetical protein